MIQPGAKEICEMALIKAIIDWNNMIFNTELKRRLSPGNGGLFGVQDTEC
jgi:hypothetical protein